MANLKPGWKIVKFGDVVRNANSIEQNPEDSGIERIVGLEHIDSENLHIRRWNGIENGTSFSRKFTPGQTLFGKRRAYQRKVAFAEFEGICSGDILTFESKDPEILLPSLLPFICQSDFFFDYALSTSDGSLSPRTSWSALKKYEFPLPPMDEQKHMANILWAADEAIERYGQLTENIRKYLQIASTRLCWNTKRGEEAIINIVKGTTDTFIDGDWIESKDQSLDGIRLIQLANIGVGEFLDTSKRFISSDTFKRLRCTEVLPGDIVISRMADPIGRACIIPDIGCRMITAVDCSIVRVNEIMHDKRFWLYLMGTKKWKRIVESYSGGSTRMRISRKNLENIKVNISPLIEQKKIVSSLDVILNAYEKSVNQQLVIRNMNLTLREKLLDQSTIG